LQALADYLTLLGLTPDQPLPDALLALIDAARGAAAKVRDRFSPDAWNALNDLAKTAGRMAERATEGDDAAQALAVLLRKISGFSGLVHENMYHFAGWRFLSLGRAQERADGTLLAAQTFAAPDAVPGALEVMIEVGDCVMTHQRRYRFGPTRETVLDLMVQDIQNPRAVLYQVATMRHHLDRLTRSEQGAVPSARDKILLRLDADLRVALPSEMTPDVLADLRARLAGVFDHISNQFFR
jgi:uncharacterized alpha-E superfamily protein